MNNKRRSLNAAMDISPEAAAFIRGGIDTPRSPTEERSMTETPAVPTPVLAIPEKDEVPSRETKNSSEPIELDRVVEGPTTERRRGRTRSRGVETNRQDQPYGMANLLVPLTTRLSPATATALKRAGLEQKLYGRQPGTVQEIAEIALQNWLQDNGYI
ncbi:hypothetical protein SH449x_000167 [Pirellulaceae bacterium SH449]